MSKDPVATLELAKRLKTYRLNEGEYNRICEMLGRTPKGVEWALFSALWSEHCSYKSSKVHLKKLFGKSARVVQSFGENAGVVDLGEGERVAFKIESHNHPSFIEPYQGAATGVGGILRDIFTMGARPIALANYLCFGDVKAPRMEMLVDGVVRGIGGYGNCVGVPTITGQTEFHSSYNNNILVNAMAVGLFRPGEKIFLSKAKGVGNWVVYVGAKTGRDGVHGASMASESFGADSAAKRPTVQIGDPFFEKLLIESCLEVMEQDLVVAIQDMGAAGLTSSSFEMAAKGEVGLDLHLDQVPLRDATMSPEDILLSESQERMLLVCEPHQYPKLKAVFERWGLDASRIGEVTASSLVRLFWHGETLTEIDPQLLVEQAPLYERPFKPWTLANREPATPLKLGSDSARSASDFLLSAFKNVRGGSRDFIYGQFDQRVGAKTARDASESVGVVRLPDSGRALGVVLGCRPHLMRFDAFVGGADSVAYPALELAAKGFEPLAVTDCLNYGNPEREQIMSEFVASLDGMNQVCRGLETPIISGNVSFYNETMGQNITSTPSTGLVGLKDTVDEIPWSHFQRSGQALILIHQSGLSCGGVAQEILENKITGDGEFRFDATCRLVNAVRKTVLHGGVSASRVVGRMGLAYALGRLCLNGVGAKVDLEGVAQVRGQKQTASDLFREHLYEIILAVPSERASEYVDLLKKEVQGVSGVQVGLIGSTSSDARLQMGALLDVSLTDLSSAYNGSWRSNFENLA